MAISWKKGSSTVLAATGLGLAASAVLRRATSSDLHGQVALITGGSRGLGFLLARELGREGCRVAICARDSAELDRAGAALKQEGIEVRTFRCDVSDPGQVERLIRDAGKHFGRVDILVNNAGIIEVGPMQSMVRADYEKAMDLMFWGLFNTTQAVLPQMRARRAGRIVNITSVGGKVSVPHLLPYSCAKFAAVGFSEGLRAELADQGIIVTTIVPGEMRTGSFPHAEFKGKQQAEYSWFAASSSLPFLSMDAERAARQIVTAIKRGEAERILTFSANLLARFHGLFPGTTSNLLGAIDRLLPSSDGGSDTGAPGKTVEERIDSSLLHTLTSWGRSAARRFNEDSHA